MATFKPDRDKLNANFDGYKLGKQTLTCVSQPFEGGVRVARLKEEDFSYQHVRAFSLYNHLAADPWDGRSVYWCTSKGAILRGKYTCSGEVKVSSVYHCPAELHPTISSVNPSLSFISTNLCLFSSGCGSSLYVLHTPPRGSPTEGGEGNGTEVEGEEAWVLQEELQLPKMEGESFCILSTHYSEPDHRLDIATLIMHSSTAVPGKGKKKAGSKPTIAMYHWHRVNLDLVRSSAKQSHALPIVSQISLGENAENEKSPATEVELLSSLCSSTLALYSTFISDHLIILSEANVVPANQSDTSDDKSENTEEEEEGKLAENMVQEPEKEEASESKNFAGLGFDKAGEGSLAQPQYQWSQTESDVTVTVALPDDVTKHDVHCVIERRDVVVGLTDGTTYFRDRLFAPITPGCSTWTIENHTLEVSLEKQREGLEWPSLKGEGEGEEGVSKDGTAGVPLHGPVTDQLSPTELAELQKKIAEATKAEDSSPAAKRHHPLVPGAYYEECDMNDDEDATFFVISHTSDISRKVSLAGRQFLFSSPSLPQTPPIFCIKHNVDAILWQPQTSPSNSTTISWTHIGTFNALAYVQAARRDKKFTVCPPNMKYAALCDCTRHVFIYLQPEEGVKGNEATQYVTTLQSAGDILGLQATDSGLVFVLSESELHVIVVS